MQLASLVALITGGDKFNRDAVASGQTDVSGLKPFHSQDDSIGHLHFEVQRAIDPWIKPPKK